MPPWFPSAEFRDGLLSRRMRPVSHPDLHAALESVAQDAQSHGMANPDAVELPPQVTHGRDLVPVGRDNDVPKRSCCRVYALQTGACRGGARERTQNHEPV